MDIDAITVSALVGKLCINGIFVYFAYRIYRNVKRTKSAIAEALKAKNLTPQQAVKQGVERAQRLDQKRNNTAKD